MICTELSRRTERQGCVRGNTEEFILTDCPGFTGLESWTLTGAGETNGFRLDDNGIKKRGHQTTTNNEDQTPGHTQKN